MLTTHIFKGENSDTPQMTYVNDPKDFYDIVFGEDTTLQAVVLMSEKTIGVSYKKKKTHQHARPGQGLVHAIMTASYGRCWLFEHMHRLGEHVWYCDTVS